MSKITAKNDRTGFEETVHGEPLEGYDWLAVHGSVGYVRAWTVTHIPTGFAMATRMTREDAIRAAMIAVRVCEEEGFDLRAVTAYEDVPEGLRKKAREALGK